MGRLLGHLAATIIIAMAMQQGHAQFTAFFNPSANCSDTCAPSLGSIAIRLCKEGLSGGGCGAVTDYIKFTPCCGNATASWSDWGDWGNCTATCGACGRQMRTRTCAVTNGCPGTCLGNDTDTSTTPCDPPNTVADTYKLCVAPMPVCCEPYHRNVSMTMKKNICTTSFAPVK
ncbi:unnamed protein product, partial [Mesorhabditis belari]|uniref:Uncharacterized protein n=1 Tax=Mesorhabditis belari TaxID=2138241 RepID=A0AAF3EUQ9_9BILA